MNNFLKYNNSINDSYLIDLAVPIIDILAPIKYSPNKKFDNRYFFTCIIDFIKNSTYWSRYKGFIDYPINGKYLNEIHNRYIKKGVYEAINKQLLNIYLKKNKSVKIKNQIIDSSFVPNKGGSIKNNNHLLNDNVKKNNKIIRKKNNTEKNYKNKIKEETFIDYNKYNGRKKYFKVSTITDSFGIPLGTSIISSKQSDNISIEQTINSIQVNLNTLKNSNNNRYKQYILADSGYCSNKNKFLLKSKGYIPIIIYNKRNTKNKKIIAQNALNKNERFRYKKRKIIESFFSWIKYFPVINQNYQKSISSYKGLFLLASSILISKKI